MPYGIYQRCWRTIQQMPTILFILSIETIYEYAEEKIIFLHAFPWKPVDGLLAQFKTRNRLLLLPIKLVSWKCIQHITRWRKTLLDHDWLRFMRRTLRKPNRTEKKPQLRQGMRGTRGINSTNKTLYSSHRIFPFVRQFMHMHLSVQCEKYPYAVLETIFHGTYSLPWYRTHLSRCHMFVHSFPIAKQFSFWHFFHPWKIPKY